MSKAENVNQSVLLILKQNVCFFAYNGLVHTTESEITITILYYHRISYHADKIPTRRSEQLGAQFGSEINMFNVRS